MRPHRFINAFRGVILTIALLLVLVSAGPTSAGAGVINTEISGNMLVNGTVYRGRVSPDGSRVVFTGDLEFNGMSELYSVPTRGGQRVRLSGDHLINGGNVDSEFQIAPNSQRVVFRADKDENDKFELWSVPITGGAPVRLNQLLAYNQDVTEFEISPDSLRVVYAVSVDGDAPINIYSVPIAGGYQQKLNGDVGSTGMAYNFEISADSKWVVYMMQNDGETVTNLYSVPIIDPIPGDRVSLNGTPDINADGVWNYQITPDGARVVYSAHQDRADATELYSVPIRGPTGSDIKLNPDFPINRYVQTYRITPDSSQVVYLADQNTDNRLELFSVPTGGGAVPIRLTDMITFTNPDADVDDDFEITPNSLGVVFRVNPAYTNTYDLYAAALDGVAWKRLSPTLADGETVDYFAIAPSSWGVVYHSNIGGRYQLYSRDMFATHAPWQLTNAGDGLVSSVFRITPDSQHVVYLADMDPDTFAVFELYSFFIRGTNYANTVRWNVPFHLAGSDVSGFILLPGSTSLIYTADTEVDEQTRIFYAFYGYSLYLPNIRR